jgi:hypothetical protein
LVFIAFQGTHASDMPSSSLARVNRTLGFIHWRMVTDPAVQFLLQLRYNI